MKIKNEIIEFAKSIGIKYIGFSDIGFEEDFVQRLKQKREKGYLSGFEEEDENKRTDLNAILNEVKTVISIALPYRTIETKKTKPYLSKSSLGMDYHKVLKTKLEQLSGFIEENYKAKCAYFTDIGPLHDREIAKKCGIGFYGKNSNIITEKYGSFVFLGEILTDIFIDRDSQAVGGCGECNLCIKACPAKAIEEPYYVNAKKCLSYVSQKKDELSDEEINKLGLRIFGCDTCQDVCPFNKIAEASNIDEFIPEKWNIDIDEEKILGMTNKEFKDSFGKTSSGWRGKDLIKRNLIIAMGNSKNREYIKILKNYKNEKLKKYIEKSLNKLEGSLNEQKRKEKGRIYSQNNN